MKFKFSKNLDYQIEAINAIVEIFDNGQNVIANNRVFKLEQLSPIVSNELEIDQGRVLKNVQNIQKLNGIESVNNLESLDFSVEMETGTGKTYVYLRTALELNKKYGLKKFIVLVPSVAIREGVLKTIEQTKEHFYELYGIKFGSFAYDSGKLSQVREFIQSIDIQVMIMTVDSFNKDANIMRQSTDHFQGDVPLDEVAKTRPVVIMDEPQNMDSDLAQVAIADLKPLFKLRYSATHKNIYNLVYRLTPVDAYKMGLVKKIEVYGVKEKDPGAFVFEVLEVKTKAGESPKGRIIVEVKNAVGQYENKEVLLKAGDDLEKKTNNTKYQGLLINEIDARDNWVELSNGKVFRVVEDLGTDKEAIFKTQIRETIKIHLKKQQELNGRMKVLSLFFIDKVDNYVKSDGMIRRIFIDEYQKLSETNPELVHKGYFAAKKEKGEVKYQDSTTGKSQADKEAYDLIMRDKERLLSFEEPTCFIFSHSALKEGWDNPNVFQICTLNETKSAVKKRQEIGRGLRLPVDIAGNQVRDWKTNVLTVVANENYKEFAKRLQAEYTEAGYKDIPEPTDATKKTSITYRFQKQALPQDFKILWEKIRVKTKYTINLDAAVLMQKAVQKINELDVHNLVIKIDKVQIDFVGNQVKTIYEAEAIGEKLDREVRIENLVEKIATQTGLTKKTVFEILSQVSNLDLMFSNPSEYMRSVIVLIQTTVDDLLANDGIKYSKTNDVWAIDLFEDFEWAGRKVLTDKSAYDYVALDSDGELEFATSLQKSSSIKFFVKLPRGFVINTPIGDYNPDWAIVKETDTGDKLYLVRETKFVSDLNNDLRKSEQLKIEFGQKHFDAIGLPFKVSQKSDLSDLL